MRRLRPAQLRAAPGNRLPPKRAQFPDLLIQNATVIRLFSALARFHPPTRLAENTQSNRTAGVKVATRFRARANGPARLEMSPETPFEIVTLKIGPCVQDSLVLTDLGGYRLRDPHRSDGPSTVARTFPPSGHRDPAREELFASHWSLVGAPQLRYAGRKATRYPRLPDPAWTRNPAAVRCLTRGPAPSVNSMMKARAL